MESILLINCTKNDHRIMKGKKGFYIYLSFFFFFFSYFDPISDLEAFIMFAGYFLCWILIFKVQ